MYERGISSAVIKRLPRYYRYLGELLEKDVIRISSKELSVKMNVTASQIRQDLNNFGGFGQQGYGYNVEYLYTEIGRILGLDRQNHVIIIGAGNLGQALANYADFERRGFVVCAIFDVNPEVIGKDIRGIVVRSMEDLQSFIAENKVDIAAITVPRQNAAKVAADLVQYGIKAIWNFAPTDLHLPPEVVSENVHLAESLMRLSYKLKNASEDLSEAERGDGD
ncbi:MAG: redox-sensing transcriptional repressor Rex [Lachnospiraceae bacterium]|nr:redox-sensing transcriptional repressor Rex [Lachnospiraceae bacterium]